MSKFIVGARSDGIYEALHAAGVFADDPNEVARVIIDLKVGTPARIYVEKCADTKLIDVLMAGSVELVEKAA